MYFIFYSFLFLLKRKPIYTCALEYSIQYGAPYTQYMTYISYIHICMYIIVCIHVYMCVHGCAIHTCVHIYTYVYTC